MSLRLAFIVDPLDKLKPVKDSSVAMMREAARRGHEIWTVQRAAITLHGNEVSAAAVRIQPQHDNASWYVELGSEPRALREFDAVMMRQDPPFDMNYITVSHILERLHPKTFVMNPPSAVRNAPEKILVTEFPELMPPTLVTRDREEIRAFRREHGNIILKPLYGNGGAGVFLIQEGDQNLNALIELFEQSFREPFMVQRYLPEVRKGDKRIILVDGEPVAGLNRIPADGEARSNMHAGGRPELSPLTEREREICAAIGPALKERDMVFVGIDVIGGYLTEINVTSPTGIREVKRFGGPDIAVLIWDALEKRRA